RREIQTELVWSYDLLQDALDRLPPMEIQLALKRIPLMAKAILRNAFNIRNLMASTHHTLLTSEDAAIAAAGFTAEKAYALEAQKLREFHASDPAQHRAPDLVTGPAVQDAWAATYTTIEAMPVEELTFLVCGRRVSQCWKESQAKITIAIGDPSIEQCFLRCAEQLGAEIKPAPAPR
ncbi:unnamed protein product, partial [Prorocentrum cordatum]